VNERWSSGLSGSCLLGLFLLEIHLDRINTICMIHKMYPVNPVLNLVNPVYACLASRYALGVIPVIRRNNRVK